MTAAMFVGYAIAVYAAAGVCTALAFMTFGVDRVLPGPISFTPGARLVLLPGAAAPWPYVILRWRKAANRR
jgi:hypothetical protein